MKCGKRLIETVVGISPANFDYCLFGRVRSILSGFASCSSQRNWTIAIFICISFIWATIEDRPKPIENAMGSLAEPKAPPTAATPFPQRPVIILGAGIIGCSIARQLLQAGFVVTLVGEFLPGDQNILYASAWAGAAWHAAAGLVDEHKYIQAVTHRHLLKLAREEPEAGVCMVNAREYVEDFPVKNSSEWGRTVTANVRHTN